MHPYSLIRAAIAKAIDRFLKLAVYFVMTLVLLALAWLGISLLFFSVYGGCR